MKNKLFITLVFCVLLNTFSSFSQNYNYILKNFNVAVNGVPVTSIVDIPPIKDIDYIISGDNHAISSDDHLVINAFDKIVPSGAKVLFAVEGADIHEYDENGKIVEMGDLKESYVHPLYEAIVALDNTRTIFGTTWDNSYYAFRYGFLLNYVVSSWKGDSYLAREGRREQLQKKLLSSLVTERNPYANVVLPQINEWYDLSWINAGFGHIEDDPNWLVSDGRVVMTLIPKVGFDSTYYDSAFSKRLKAKADSFYIRSDQLFEKRKKSFEAAGFSSFKDIVRFFDWYGNISSESSLPKEIFAQFLIREGWDNRSIGGDSISILLHEAKLAQEIATADIDLKESEIGKKIYQEQLDSSIVALSKEESDVWQRFELSIETYLDKTDDELYSLLKLSNEVLWSKFETEVEFSETYNALLSCFVSFKIREKSLLIQQGIYNQSQIVFSAERRGISYSKALYDETKKLRNIYEKEFIKALNHPTSSGAELFLEMMAFTSFSERVRKWNEIKYNKHKLCL